VVSHATIPLIVLPAAYLLLGRRTTSFRYAPLALLVCVTMTCVYFAAFLTTPWDLQLHLVTSADRLFLHLWPSFLLWFFINRATAESLLDQQVQPSVA
jgi:hypothetical protein